MDVSFEKKIQLAKKATLTFSSEFFNLFNHVNFLDPAVSLQSPQTFGVLTTQANDPRQESNWGCALIFEQRVNSTSTKRLPAPVAPKFDSLRKVVWESVPVRTDFFRRTAGRPANPRKRGADR